MPALRARVRVRAFLRDRRGAAQLRIDLRINLPKWVSDLLWLLLGDDLGRLRFSLCVFEDKLRFRRSETTGSNRGCGEHNRTGDNDQGGRKTSHKVAFYGAERLPP